MGELVSRDIEYTHDGTRMLGHLCAPRGARNLPCVVLIHDAFGLTAELIHTARRFAALGVTVFAADVWGERTTPASQADIGPLIGGMVSDRHRWMGRVDAAHAAAASQPEADAASLLPIGYCFGGASALEYLRSGADVRGAVSIHGGLDLLEPGWEAATASAHVLVCTGADDPMATTAQREALQSGMTSAGIDWQVDLYSHTTHAFTSPQAAHSPDQAAAAYNPRSAARAWAATSRFLADLFCDVIPTSPQRRPHDSTAE